MNFFRKSSMILAGTAAAGLLAFACAGGNDVSGSGSSADEIIQSSTKDLLIAKVYAGGGSKDVGALPGDYVEIFNPTERAIPRKLLSLQLADAQGAFSKDYIINLADPNDDDATIESGHYFLVSLTPGASLGVTPSFVASPAPLADGGQGLSYGLDVTGGSVALVNSEDPLDCDQPSNCAKLPNVKSVFGYGAIAGSVPLAEKKPFAALTTTTAAVRRGGGCFASGSSAVDFVSSDPAPFDPAVGVDCSKVDAGGPVPDDDAGTKDAGAVDSGPVKDGGTKPPAKDAGPKADAATDDGDSDDDGTPAPTTGKKKVTNANVPPQPIATSDSSSCAAAPGPIPTSSLAGLAGLGLVVAALGRRKKK